MRAKRIGIYSGVFDPVHVGHITFALQALAASKLDKVYFLPERRPRDKHGVEHFGHRVAMLRQALKPYNKFGLLELDDVSFSIQRTLPALESQFPNDQLVFLFGSDAVLSMMEWPRIERLFISSELVVGMRHTQTVHEIKKVVAGWPAAPVVTLINSYAPDVSSTSVREALQTRKVTKGLLKSVAQYSNNHWLYISLAENPS
jgi:nicotinate-nucleotide adenylyltransferase